MKPLLSRSWSAGSLSLGARHMVSVKEEGKRSKNDIAEELKVRVFLFRNCVIQK